MDARIDHVKTVERATTIAEGNAKVHTVEHVLSALTGLGVDNAVVELDAAALRGVEVDIVDEKFRPVPDGRGYDLIGITAMTPLAPKAYRMAGTGPKQVQVAEVHDCFTIAEIVAGPIEEALRGLAERLSQKPRQAFQQIRLAVTGSNVSPSLFESLELLVAIDILPTETASLAHWVLPATTPLERFDLPKLGPMSAQALHYQIEAMRRAYLDLTGILANLPGCRDRIASAPVTREAFFERVRSAAGR